MSVFHYGSDGSKSDSSYYYDERMKRHFARIMGRRFVDTAALDSVYLCLNGLRRRLATRP